MKNLIMKLFNKGNKNSCVTILTEKRYKKCIELIKKPKRRTSLTYFFENVAGLKQNIPNYRGDYRRSNRRIITSLYSQQEY